MIVATFRSFLNKKHYRYLIYTTSIVLLIGVLGFRFLEKWRWIDCVNYAVSTMVTTGNAGVQPVTDFGKIFNIFYMIISVVLILFFVNTIQKHFQDQRQSFQVKHLRHKKLAQKHVDDSLNREI